MMDLSPYVTRPQEPSLPGTRDVFCVHNLPTEIISVLFGKYSRSTKGLRAEMAAMLQETQDLTATKGTTFDLATEKASKFHSLYTLGYGHQCYDEKTDVLTSIGWMRWRTALKRWNNGERFDLASLNPKTKALEFVRPLRMIQQHYSGDMYRIKFFSVDLLVTPNHKMWVAPSIAHQQYGEYRLLKAEDIVGQCVRYSLTAEAWDGPCPDTLRIGGKDVPASALMKMIGFFIGDGYHDPRYHSGVSFNLRKKRKIRYLKAIAKECGFDLTVYANGKIWVRFPGLGDFLGRCYDQNRRKHIPREYLAFGRPILNELLEGLLNSDGSKREGGYSFCTSSVPLKEQFFELGVRLGFATKARRINNPGVQKDTFVLSVNRTRLSPIVNKRRAKIVDHWEEYEGDVYCAELPRNHTLFVRRNGRAVWSGNSLGDSAYVYVAVENCSMMAAKVLQDARLAGFIEKSTRYVPFDPSQSLDVESLGVPAQGRAKASEAFSYLLREYAAFSVKIRAHLAQHVERPMGLKDAQWEKLLDTKTFDLCRGLLPFGTRTSFGMAMDARELAHSLQKWSESPFLEVRLIAEEIRTEASKVVPTLLKHSNSTGYYTSLRERLSALSSKYDRGSGLDWASECGTGAFRRTEPRFGERDNVAHCLSTVTPRLTTEQQLKLLKRAICEEHPYVFDVMSAEELIRAYLEGHTLHEQPGRALEAVTYPFLCMEMDLGAWRDMQRHRMTTQLSYNALPDGINNLKYLRLDAYLDPFWAEDATFDALRDEYQAVMDHQQSITHELFHFSGFGADLSWGPALMPLSTAVEWRPTLNLREAIYVVERRSVPEGHPTYRRSAQQLATYLYEQLPVLKGLLHVDMTMPTFARQAPLTKAAT